MIASEHEDLYGRRGSTRSTEDGEPEQETLRVRTPDGRERAVEGRLVVGSSADCDLVLADEFVSGRHCVLARTGHRTTVTDCGSRNGTWVAGAQIEAATVRAGTRLRVGHTALLIVGGAAVEEQELRGDSVAMRRLRRELARLATSNATALLLGESGTGKELAARALHRGSGRRGPFVAVNCGAIAPELVESVLFGHERGAFTGAAARHIGYFEEAEGGTLFLDEIGELPLGLQAKLLRALEERSIRPVGSSSERRVDVRVVAATHQDLEAAVTEKRFRLDLYHRLAQLPVRLPSLRDRPEDIIPLARHFLGRLAAETGETRRLLAETEEELARRTWPGNVRELQNALQRAWVLGDGLVIAPADLPELVVMIPTVTTANEATAGYSRIDLIEKEMIREALRSSGGNRRAAAAALGMPKSTLCDKARRYGLTT